MVHQIIKNRQGNVILMTSYKFNVLCVDLPIPSLVLPSACEYSYCLYLPSLHYSWAIYLGSILSLDNYHRHHRIGNMSSAIHRVFQGLLNRPVLRHSQSSRSLDPKQVVASSCCRPTATASSCPWTQLEKFSRDNYQVGEKGSSHNL